MKPLSRTTRLSVVIGISSSFFLAELAIGFYTGSIAVIADSFHYLNDLVGFIVALVCHRMSQRRTAPENLSFGWQRAQLLGAFFNGVFLFGLGISIFLQSIERFINLERLEDPKLVLIIGCVGFGLNVVSAVFLHEHSHDEESQKEPGDVELNLKEAEAHSSHRHVQHKPVKPGYDFGMLGVLLHVVGDAANNIGVIIAALVIWLTHYEGRFYADPGVSMGISLMILASSIPLIRKASEVLLDSAPSGLKIDDIKHDMESIPGISSVHELHVWRLNQGKSLATAHLVMDCSNNETRSSKMTMEEYMRIAETATHCLHAYGVHSATLQPECFDDIDEIQPVKPNNNVATILSSTDGVEEIEMQSRSRDQSRSNGIHITRAMAVARGCRLLCGSNCSELKCCADEFS